MSRNHSEIPIVLIAAAIELMELLFKNFKLHGVPRKIYLQLMEEIEDEIKIPLETQNPSDLIGEIDNDVLIIHDLDDRTTPIEPARKIAKQLKNVSIVETEGFGHNKMLRETIVIERSLAFVKKYQPIQAVDYLKNETVAVE